MGYQQSKGIKKLKNVPAFKFLACLRLAALCPPPPRARRGPIPQRRGKGVTASPGHTCDGAADSAAAGSDARAVPDHGVLGPLVGLPDPVSRSRVLVKAGLFSYGAGGKSPSA